MMPVSDRAECPREERSAPVVVDLPAAMIAIADLLAETLAFESKWSPELDAARTKARALLREWSART